MRLLGEKPLFRCIIAVLTVFTVVISSSLAASAPQEAACSASSRANNAEGRICYYSPELGAELPLFTGLDDSDISSKKDFQRIVSYMSADDLSHISFVSQFKANQNFSIINRKDSILVNLRI